MSTEHREQVRVVKDDDFARKQQIVEHRPSTKNVIVSRVSQLIWLVIAIVMILIAFRFVFFLLAVNPANGFANAIYAVTDVLVAPFVTLLSTPSFENGAAIDLASVFAMIVYPLVGWAIVQFLRILFADSRGIRRVKTIQRENYD